MPKKNKEMDQDSGGSKDPALELNNAEKIFLLLLRAEGGKAVPRNLWLQKEMFLVAKNLKPLEDYLEFEPNVQGPYSEAVNNILEDLRYRGLVVKKKSGEIHLTEKGEDVAADLYSRANEELIALVEDVKDLMNDLSKDELLVYIYYTYPEMTKESLEKDDLEPKREQIANKLYERRKISLEKASELAGKPLVEFRA